MSSVVRPPISLLWLWLSQLAAVPGYGSNEITGQGVIPGRIQGEESLVAQMWALQCCLPSRPDSEPWPMLFTSPDKATRTSAHGQDPWERWCLWVTLQSQHSITSSTEREAATFPACCRFCGGNFGSWEMKSYECWCGVPCAILWRPTSVFESEWLFSSSFPFWVTATVYFWLVL